MKKLPVLCLLSATLSGCASQTLHMNHGRVDEVPDERVSQSFFMGGIAQKENMDAAAICGGSSRVARVETVTAPLDALLTALTVGIYSPRTAKVYCVQ